jgi:hypothetical protein
MEYPMTRWSTAISRAQLRNIKVIPWVRLAHVGAGEGLNDVKARLDMLVRTARVWNTDTILPNYEDEADVIPPNVVKLALDETGWTGNTGWSTQAWLPNGPDFTAMREDAVLLQIFPTDLNWPKDYGIIKKNMGDCVYHARDKGFTYVSVTYQTYDDATPGIFDVDSYMHSVYPGNEIQHGEWPQWFQ